MSKAFQDAIQAAIANQGLQSALDANAERRIKAIETARASLPEPWEVMRRKAHVIRSAVIENLEENLELFVRNVRANGVQVHFAANAQEASRIVREIAQKNQVKLVAKSKSMVSEEVGLNHSLQAEGIEVIETDLGEYIVQLRGERPAHIITPAVHLRRADVGQTFHEKLGIPLTKDIPTLTAAARTRLRDVFLKAGMGVSGVNFGVIQDGTLCIVTNEGNGGMVTTLPRIHVALMGIERMVPDQDALALMLYLLPRSATGQKLTVYTSLMRGPKGADEPDGPYERHLVLVDNGRRRMRDSSLQEALLCIRCGACINACPIFREIGGHAYVNPEGESSTYPGPIGSIVSPGLFGQKQFGDLARASSLCGACKEACPVDIDLPKMLLRVRAGQTPLEKYQSGKAIPNSHKPNAPQLMTVAIRLYAWFASSPARFHLAQRVAALFGKLASPFSDWIRLPAFTGWGLSKDFPRPSTQTFRQRFAEYRRHQKQEPPPLVTQPSIDPQHKPQPTRTEPDTETNKSLVDRFETELASLGGRFTRCNKDNLGQEILAALREAGYEEILAWSEENFQPGILDQLKSEGITISYTPDPNIRAGLTASAAGIAETGSLVLTSGPGKPKTASLTTDLHLAVLKSSQITARLPEALKLEAVRNSSTSVIISGPSRTADIEMTLSIGVHGPGAVHIFCLE